MGAFLDWVLDYRKKHTNLLMAERLGIHKSVIPKWFSHGFSPNVFVMREIVKLSRGKVKYVDIVEDIIMQKQKFLIRTKGERCLKK